MKTKILLTCLLLSGLYAAWTQFYSYDIDHAASHVESHALDRSHCCCAWHVMRAMLTGDCPIGIYPARMYRYVLPLHRFRMVPKEDYRPKKCDIVVFNHTPGNFWDRIAMYDGRQWVSDFRQKSMFVYKFDKGYRIFRIKPSNRH